jgi:dolichol-phosphate mannosyltransferase
MDFSRVSLGIGCPMANEKANAEAFTLDVLKACEPFGFKEVVFNAVLDNVSTDGTVDIMREMAAKNDQVELVWAPENRCVVDAYVRAYQACLDGGYDWVLEIDAGYSHRPEDIEKFFQKMAEGNDCVFATRYTKGGKMTQIHPINFFISRGGTFLANAVLGTKLSDMTSGFELFSAKALRWILDQGLISRGSFFQTELKAHAHNFKIDEVGIIYRPTPSRVRASEISNSLQSLFALRKRIRTGSKP